MSERNDDRLQRLVGNSPCPRCSGLVPGKISVGGMSYMPPKWKTCPKCNGKGVLPAMPPALLPEERETGKLRYPITARVDWTASCVHACAGMEEPRAAIDGLRGALMALVGAVQSGYTRRAVDLAGLVENGRRALARANADLRGEG